MAIWIDDLLFTVDRHTVSLGYGIWYYLLVPSVLTPMKTKAEEFRRR